VNKHCDIGQFYDVAEALSILSTNDLLFEEYKLSEECVSANKVFLSAGRDEIMERLAWKVSQGEMCIGIYTYSLYNIYNRYLQQCCISRRHPSSK
jgi:histidinol-phosphate/aromatic aminotransferase/cobyric acid decarboxylase-like protein